MTSETETSTARTAPTWWRPDLLFVALALVFGTLFIAINPPFWGNDGVSQYSRAYQISHGQLLPQEIEWDGKGESYGGHIPSSVQDLIDVAVPDMADGATEPEPKVADASRYDELESQPYDTEATSLTWFTNTAQYSPVSYLPASAASLGGELLGLSVGVTLFLMAFACLLAYVVPVALGLRALGDHPLAWLGLGLGLIPPALLQASTITADAMTNGLALCFFALVAKGVALRRSFSRFDTGLLVATMVLLPLGKPTYLVLVALAFAIPRRLLPGPRWVLPTAFGVSTALWAAWTVIIRDLPGVTAFYRADYAESEFGLGPMLRDTLTDPVHFIGNLVRTFIYRENYLFLDLIGGSGVRVPSIVMLLTAVTLVLAALNVPRFETTRWVRWMLTAVSLVSIVALFATLYVSFTPVGYHVIDGVQGRYFFPLWPFFILTILAWFPRRLDSAVDARTGTTTVPRFVVVAMATGLALTLLKFYGAVWGSPF